MVVNHTTFIRWYKPVTADPETLYSKKNQKRIRSALSKIEQCSVRCEFKMLDQDFLDWFTPYYEQTIAQKKNAKVHDLHKATFGRDEHKYTYWCITIFEGDLKVGGAILFVGKAPVMISYKATNHAWEKAVLQVSPSLYMDYMISRWAFTEGKEYISHGKDRNPYGVNSAIGLATYKLNAGYIPRNLKLADGDTHEVVEIDTDTIDNDALIMQFPPEGDIIKNAVLVATQETLEKYPQLTNGAGTLEVQTILRN